MRWKHKKPGAAFKYVPAKQSHSIMEIEQLFSMLLPRRRTRGSERVTSVMDMSRSRITMTSCLFLFVGIPSSAAPPALLPLVPVATEDTQPEAEPQMTIETHASSSAARTASPAWSPNAATASQTSVSSSAGRPASPAVLRPLASPECARTGWFGLG